jgi:predicted membrane protein
MAAVAIFAQTILGAGVRHNAIGLAPHLVGAALAAGLAMWASMGILIHHMEETALRRPALALLMLTAAQIFLGLAAYAARQAAADDPQPMPLMVWATVAHVVVGALAFGAAIALAMAVFSRRARPAAFNA